MTIPIETKAIHSPQIPIETIPFKLNDNPHWN